MSDDDPKKSDARSVILARRARFVAAAMASLGIACGKEQKKPEVCLSVAVLDASGEPSAVDASMGEVDAGGGVDGSAPPSDAAAPTDAGLPPKLDGGPAPQPCLKVVAPRPCLKVAPSK
ncbi:MAG: hypothetical protein JST00_17695 [Deltaproteobacteria bacterium]|nr:hypothetical protein [Deltaproteobacteria bacterium]